MQCKCYVNCYLQEANSNFAFRNFLKFFFQNFFDLRLVEFADTKYVDVKEWLRCILLGGLKFFRWVISFSPFCQQLRGDDRGWDGWMASLTRWTWAWVNSGSWWGTGRPGVLRFMGSQRVGHYWATDLIWSEDWTLSYWPPGADRKSGWVIWKIRKFLPPNTNKHHLELSFIV